MGDDVVMSERAHKLRNPAMQSNCSNESYDFLVRKRFTNERKSVERGTMIKASL
jgi:hypothetical protein